MRCIYVYMFLYLCFVSSLQEKRKTINGEDILWAMNALGFDNYVEPLKIYLQKFREVGKCSKCSYLGIKFIEGIIHLVLLT